MARINRQSHYVRKTVYVPSSGARHPRAAAKPIPVDRMTLARAPAGTRQAKTAGP